MELKSEFRVGIPVEQTWNTLTDVEFIAPCMPGAQLTEIDGDEFKGGVKIKVGPITAQYKGCGPLRRARRGQPPDRARGHRPRLARRRQCSR